MGISRKSRIYSFLAVILLSTSVAIAGGVKDAVNQAKNQAIQNAFSYGDSAIESWARDNLSSLRLIEVESRSRADSKPTFRAITLFELTGNQFDKILSQISYSTFNDRETINTGLVYRSMNQAMTHIYGINIFYDREFNTGHARTGLGFEMKSSAYDVNINLYEAMTAIHHVNGAPEVAAGGYDAEVGALLPYLPWAKLYYKRYQWNNETHNAFIKLNYIVCCNERKAGPGIFSVSSSAYTFGKIDEDRMYEKVRRENNIVKVRGGGGLAITASGF